MADDAPPANRLAPDEVARELARVERLAWHMARRLARRARRPELVEDLAAAVRLGFVKAAARFDPTAGTPFLGYVGKAGWRDGCRLLTHEMARGLGVPTGYAVAAPRVYPATRLAADGTESSLFDAVAARADGGDPPDVRPGFWAVAGTVLSPRQLEVLRLRLVEGLTHPEAGGRLGFSRGRSHQIEKQAVEKLRAPAVLDRLRRLLEGT